MARAATGLGDEEKDGSDGAFSRKNPPTQNVSTVAVTSSASAVGNAPTTSGPDAIDTPCASTGKSPHAQTRFRDGGLATGTTGRNRGIRAGLH